MKKLRLKSLCSRSISKEVEESMREVMIRRQHQNLMNYKRWWQLSYKDILRKILLLQMWRLRKIHPISCSMKRQEGFQKMLMIKLPLHKRSLNSLNQTTFWHPLIENLGQSFKNRKIYHLSLTSSPLLLPNSTWNQFNKSTMLPLKSLEPQRNQLIMYKGKDQNKVLLKIQCKVQ